MIPKTTPERLSFFSDAIFAVLITVLVLELRPPERPVFEALLERWPTWLSYAVSYLFTSNRRRRVWQTTVWRHGKIGFGRNSRFACALQQRLLDRPPS